MKVVIVGGGSSGWMAASMLSRLMGQQLDITLVESDDIGTVGVGEATIPPIAHFNRVLGLNEHEFMRATGGTYKLGIEFDGWYNSCESYMHAFGRIGKDMGLAGFHHTWLRAHANGEGGSYWDYSLNYQVAKANKYQPLPKIPNTQMQGLVHAYHFDAGLYAKYLRMLSEQCGVNRREGKIEQVLLSPQSGEITGVQLSSGQVISGDFFIDCSGFKSLLLGETLKTGYQDWRHLLPCDRAIAVPSQATSPILPYTKSIAHSAGWQWRIPLQHRTGNGLVYCSDYYTEQQAQDLLLASIDSQPLAEPKVLKFVTGRREKQWYKNCVALGLSSGFLEPLESTSLHLVQSGIVRLVKLFPRHSIKQTDVDEFNRQSKIEFERIRDFIILHYVLNNREEAFWQRCREMSIPDSLSQKINLFKQSGLVFREQDELFTEIAWYQVMIGQGIIPTDYHPLADALPQASQKELLDNLKVIMQGTARQLSDHQGYLQQFCAMTKVS
ncbi:tryptophan halogenase family protein [Glaciecola sp. 1036]|uniref:tryptophan halogenase family protein n=1 Tax=Alteromonadaceae TaxID=72275 RepID=UPI003D05E310